MQGDAFSPTADRRLLDSYALNFKTMIWLNESTTAGDTAGQMMAWGNARAICSKERSKSSASGGQDDLLVHRRRARGAAAQF